MTKKEKKTGSSIKRLVCKRSDSLFVGCTIKLSITGTATHDLMSSLGTLSLCAEKSFVIQGLLSFPPTAVIIFCAIEY